ELRARASPPAAEVSRDREARNAALDRGERGSTDARYFACCIDAGARGAKIARDPDPALVDVETREAGELKPRYEAVADAQDLPAQLLAIREHQYARLRSLNARADTLVDRSQRAKVRDGFAASRLICDERGEEVGQRAPRGRLHERAHVCSGRKKLGRNREQKRPGSRDHDSSAWNRRRVFDEELSGS